jgi:hypothetical protein
VCQLYELHLTGEELSRFKRILHFGKRSLRFLKNRAILLNHTLNRFINRKSKSNVKPDVETLQPGDEARVKSKEEILKTLDGWRRYTGCRFMDEMWQYCGGTYQVYKKVDYMLDETTMKMKRCTNMVILDGLICNGSWPFKKCDRSCFFFWRTEWLEKVK